MNVDSLTTNKILIQPILECCSAIYLDATQKVTETIERVQNKAIRIIVSAPKIFSDTTSRSILSLPTFRLIANLFTEKCVNFQRLFMADAPLNKL
mgnify:CR=1 FL=1